MRALQIAVATLLLSYALRAVVRWLLQSPSKPRRRDAVRPADGEMVLDPECGVYVLKERAVTRVIRGSVLRFCGEACAAAYEARR